MINLLPPELKEQYVYGRRNVTLRRWAIALTCGLLGVIVITFGGILLMQRQIHTFHVQVASSQDSLKSQNLDGTRVSAKNITDSVKLATTVLSNEILFSKLLTKIAQVLPADTRLSDLTISSDQTAVDIKADATNYSSATQIQVNLQDPDNQIFSRADIQSITCGGNTADPNYPCTVTLRALFEQNNPFLFINKGSK